MFYFEILKGGGNEGRYTFNNLAQHNLWRVKKCTNFFGGLFIKGLPSLNCKTYGTCEIIILKIDQKFFFLMYEYPSKFDRTQTVIP